MKISFLSLAAAALAVATAAPTKRQAADDKVIVGYWVPWGRVPVAALDMTKVTHINYGFGILIKRNPDPATITFDRYYDGTPMKELVKRGNASGVKILMSIGGWTGSQTFSSVVADTAARKRFINNALVFVRKNTLPEYAENPDGWGMHGLDIDWEYPGRGAAICNQVSPNDSANYLILLRELRAALDAEFPTDRKLLTAAVRVMPFDGTNGQPMTDVSAFHPYYDFINIMAYDIMGGWSATTGPNAPFDVVPGADPFSYNQSINSWLQAGWPKSKLVMGTAFYGRSMTATVDMVAASPRSIFAPKTNVTPKGGSSDSNEPNFFCNEGSVYSGMWKWKEVREAILTTSLTTPVAGWTRVWDEGTKTPWLFRQSDKTFISYDDPESLAIKVQKAKADGLRGVMYWDMTYDYNNELLNVLQQIKCTSNCPIPTPRPTTTTAVVPTSTTTVPVSTSTSPGVTPNPGKCTGVANWNIATVYANTNTKVVHAGRLWSNRWWTQGDEPSVSNAWGVWSDQGAC
ncbi:hypothetical protein DFQ26_003369 [Actinomortierella ambigua]|nr:hypothetical protein DFQ26_003369 [Actinomortierella ambigua]